MVLGWIFDEEEEQSPAIKAVHKTVSETISNSLMESKSNVSNSTSCSSSANQASEIEIRGSSYPGCEITVNQSAKVSQSCSMDAVTKITTEDYQEIDKSIKSEIKKASHVEESGTGGLLGELTGININDLFSDEDDQATKDAVTDSIVEDLLEVNTETLVENEVNNTFGSSSSGNQSSAIRIWEDCHAKISVDQEVVLEIVSEMVSKNILETIKSNINKTDIENVSENEHVEKMRGMIAALGENVEGTIVGTAEAAEGAIVGTAEAAEGAIVGTAEAAEGAIGETAKAAGGAIETVSGDITGVANNLTDSFWQIGIIALIGMAMGIWYLNSSGGQAAMQSRYPANRGGRKKKINRK